ncbi:MAG: histidine--tRNA ligase [Gemmatimonadota bacterium]
MPNHSALPGFRDFYPEDFTVRAHIVHAWRDVARRYGFEEYDGPPLEPLDLYTEKSGQEIVGQLYAFEDKGGRQVALRPEMTPTLARMAGARAGSLRKPVRWFTVPQLFRYERTQRGRLREHFQWNVDILGEGAIEADAEVLAVALDALRQLGLGAEHVVARFNDRRLLEAVLRHGGVPDEALAATYAVIDKLGRESAERTRERLETEAGLTPAAVATVLELPAMTELADVAERWGGVPAVAAEVERLETYGAVLAELGFGAWVRFDPSIVRGLAYYTGTVFEIFDRQGELRAICGGGRYDRLLGALGGSDLPAVGFGMGDVVLRELLAEHGLLPDTAPRVDYYVVCVSEAERPLGRRVAQALRAAGWSVGYDLRGAGMGRQFKNADARGAARVVVLGPDEVAAGVAVVRDMSAGEEQRVPLAELLLEAG